MFRSHFQAHLRSLILFAAAAWLALAPAQAGNKKWTSEFPGEKSFATSGDNYFLPLIPGLFQVLETPNHRVKVVVTVTDKTKIVDGVETRRVPTVSAYCTSYNEP